MMNNLDMDKLQVVTQEMFDSWCEKAKNGPVEVFRIIINNCVIDGLTLDEQALYRDNTDFEFRNCYIKSIFIKESFKNPFSDGIFLDSLTFESCVVEVLKSDNDSNSITFNKCEITNFCEIDKYEHTEFIDCTFVNPLPWSCPSSGEFIGYKKCILGKIFDKDACFYYEPYCIVKLLIPEDARRLNSITPYRPMVKCRCDKARVLGIFDSNGNELDDSYVGISKYVKDEHNIIYKVREWVYSDNFDEDESVTCSHGIHFFMRFEDAAKYE